MHLAVLCKPSGYLQLIFECFIALATAMLSTALILNLKRSTKQRSLNHHLIIRV